MSSALQMETAVPPMDKDVSCEQSGAPESLSQPNEKRKRDDGENLDPSSGSDPPKQHPLWKTSLCSYFRRSDGECSHGDTCRFAHSESELRPRPDNTWDPTSERVKKMARKDEENGKEGKCGEETINPMMTEAVAVSKDGEYGAGEDALTKCLVNLPMKWAADNLRNFLKDQGISFLSAKKKKGMVVGFITFESVAQLKIAQEGLEGKTVGNKSLKVEDVIPRSREMKNNASLPPLQTVQHAGKSASSSVIDNHESMNNMEDDDETKCESLPTNGEDLRTRRVRDAVTPLAHLPYADQLEQKKSSLKKSLKKLTQNARKACPNGVPLPEWVLKAREIGGLPCTLEGILEAPLINGYRNKCEFSVGYSMQGKATVGFLLGNFREGVTAVEEPVDCPNVSRIACRYAAIFQDFLQTSSLPIWNRLNNNGFWRQLTVREGRMSSKIDTTENSGWSVSEVLLMVQVCTVGLDEGIVNSEFQRMAQAFSDGAAGESPCLPLTSVVVQDHTGISNVAAADAPLRSLPIGKDGCVSEGPTINDRDDAGIHDCISNLRFRISPTAFFQVNTLAAEKLYALAGDWAGLGRDTLLFDICCGTGTIGLTLAHRVGMVVGIEMNASAVSDAKRNAEINGIKNCRFICSKAEDVMGSLLKEYATLPHKEDDIPEETKKNDDQVNAEDELKSTKETENNEGQVNVEEELKSTETVSQIEERSDVEQQNDDNQCVSLKVEGQSEKSQSAEDSSHSSHRFKNIVAIVDPPRVGLHPTVIKVLRTNPSLRRLVYISCNPDSLVANAIELCTPSADKSEKGNNKNNRGWRNMSSAGLARHRTKSMPVSEPFKPVKAMAVDLFPHTPHCELVMLLER